MADSGNASTPETRRRSGANSPSLAKSPPPRFEPITPDPDQDDEPQSTGDRRVERPPAITTSTGSSLSHSITSDTSAGGQRTPTPRQPPPLSSQSQRQQVMSPEPISTTLRSKKPALSRKPSKLPAPLKGQEFSADDDPDEYQSDVAAQRRVSSRTVSGPALRRQGSTLRRRPTAHASSLARVESQGEEEEEEEEEEEGRGRTPTTAAPPTEEESDPPTSGEETLQVDASEDEGEVGEDEDDDVSDAESFTLRDKQTAINQTHPFGIRIWKPALYQKNRSIEKTAEGDIHSSPGGRVSRWLVVLQRSLDVGLWLVACPASSLGWMHLFRSLVPC